jgi:hypothetical protein
MARSIHRPKRKCGFIRDLAALVLGRLVDDLEVDIVLVVVAAGVLQDVESDFFMKRAEFRVRLYRQDPPAILAKMPADGKVLGPGRAHLHDHSLAGVIREKILAHDAVDLVFGVVGIHRGSMHQVTIACQYTDRVFARCTRAM